MPEEPGPPEDDVDPLEDPPGDLEPVVPPPEDPLEGPELLAVPLEEPVVRPEDPDEDPDDDPPGPAPDELALPPGAAGVLVDPAGDVRPGELPLLAQPGIASKAKHPTTMKVDDMPKRFDFQGATISLLCMPLVISNSSTHVYSAASRSLQLGLYSGNTSTSIWRNWSLDLACTAKPCGEQQYFYGLDALG